MKPAPVVKKQGRGLDLSFLTSLLPIVLMLVVFVFIFRMLKNMFPDKDNPDAQESGLGSFLGALMGNNGDPNVASTKKTFATIHKNAEKAKIVPTSSSNDAANVIYQWMNSQAVAFMSSGFWDGGLPHEFQQKIYDKLRGKGGRWVVEVYLSYGTKRVPFRGAPVFRFFQDNTGTLLNHVDKYFDGDLKKKTSELIQACLKAYL